MADNSSHTISQVGSGFAVDGNVNSELYINLKCNDILKQNLSLYNLQLRLLRTRRYFPIKFQPSFKAQILE